ncbi:protein krueppel-like [Takifugu rubripes]|uniref:protein krueppel-like n=1 Tax=Takifugu rubripes TaxID=31033 RepID=UPI0011456EB2|nr:protein krueppel-like [Takifugu rubripes]
MFLSSCRSTSGPTPSQLTVHTRVHTGETPDRCPDCGRSFKCKIHLDNHMKVQSGHKPFACSKSYLPVHMRTHNGERPYRCSVCEQAFTQSHCLKSHMKRHQEGGPAGTT